MRTLRALILAALTLAVSSPALAQNPNPATRDRAVIQNRLGWDYMKSEAFDRAADAFQSAIDIDPTFETPYYVNGVGAFIIEDQFLVTETGHETMNTLPYEFLELGT